jgi:hypothetical protein
MARLAEDPLIDRLKELGLDFVADVLEGKRKPNAHRRLQGRKLTAPTTAPIARLAKLLGATSVKI